MDKKMMICPNWKTCIFKEERSLAWYHCDGEHRCVENCKRQYKEVLGCPACVVAKEWRCKAAINADVDSSSGGCDATENECEKCPEREYVEPSPAPLSRSVQRRLAAQKGEPAPDFSQHEPMPQGMLLIDANAVCDGCKETNCTEGCHKDLEAQRDADMAWHKNEVRQLKNEITDLRSYINYAKTPKQQIIEDALYAVSVELRDTGLLSDEAIMEILQQAHLRAMGEKG